MWRGSTRRLSLVVGQVEFFMAMKEALRMSEDILITDEQNQHILDKPRTYERSLCFYASRLPVNSLFENLEGGVSIDEWLEAFPSVTREQAIAVLEYARSRMLEPVA